MNLCIISMYFPFHFKSFRHKLEQYLYYYQNITWLKHSIPPAPKAISSTKSKHYYYILVCFNFIILSQEQTVWALLHPKRFRAHSLSIVNFISMFKFYYAITTVKCSSLPACLPHNSSFRPLYICMSALPFR